MTIVGIARAVTVRLRQWLCDHRAKPICTTQVFNDRLVLEQRCSRCGFVQRWRSEDLF